MFPIELILKRGKTALLLAVLSFLVLSCHGPDDYIEGYWRFVGGPETEAPSRSRTSPDRQEEPQELTRFEELLRDNDPEAFQEYMKGEGRQETLRRLRRRNARGPELHFREGVITVVEFDEQGSAKDLGVVWGEYRWIGEDQIHVELREAEFVATVDVKSDSSMIWLVGEREMHFRRLDPTS